MNLQQGFRRIAKVVAFLMLLVFIINAKPSLEMINDWDKYKPQYNATKIAKVAKQNYPIYKNIDDDRLAILIIKKFQEYKIPNSFWDEDVICENFNYKADNRFANKYFTEKDKLICTFKKKDFPELYSAPPQKLYLRLFNCYSDLIIILPFILILMIIPFATYYAYIGLEKVFLWIKDGFTKD